MQPLVAPSAPGYVANRSSKLRFSWMMMMTCLMGLEPVPEARESAARRSRHSSSRQSTKRCRGRQRKLLRSRKE